MNRITNAHLDAILARINRIFGYGDGTKLWNRVNDRNVATVGMFCFDDSYGQRSLRRMVNEAGGETVIIERCSKSELASRMFAFIEGVNISQENK